MKGLLLPLLLCSFFTQAQNILRVNNSVGVNAPYTTLAAAITAAGANDIIMVEGSLLNYGNITINKKVNIVGPGYFLSENLNLQASPFLSASIAALTLTAGADGSSLYGMNFTSIGISQGVLINNIAILNCRMTAIALFGIGNNFFVSGCYISNLFNFSPVATYTGTTLTNNYIGGISGTFSTSATSLVTLTQNVFGGTVGSLLNCDVRNNIFLSTISGPATGALIKNNVFNESQASLAGLDAPVDNTNVFSALTSNLFIGLTGNTTDTQWRLKAGSPAIGAGISGEDCGMYGGNTAYRPSGIRQGQPTITNFTTPSSIPKNGTLNVKVSAKVN